MPQPTASGRRPPPRIFRRERLATDPNRLSYAETPSRGTPVESLMLSRELAGVTTPGVTHGARPPYGRDRMSADLIEAAASSGAAWKLDPQALESIQRPPSQPHGPPTVPTDQALRAPPTSVQASARGPGQERDGRVNAHADIEVQPQVGGAAHAPEGAQKNAPPAADASPLAEMCARIERNSPSGRLSHPIQPLSQQELVFQSAMGADGRAVSLRPRTSDESGHLLPPHAAAGGSSHLVYPGAGHLPRAGSYPRSLSPSRRGGRPYTHDLFVSGTAPPSPIASRRFLGGSLKRAPAVRPSGNAAYGTPHAAVATRGYHSGLSQQLQPEQEQPQPQPSPSNAKRSPYQDIFPAEFPPWRPRPGAAPPLSLGPVAGVMWKPLPSGSADGHPHDKGPRTPMASSQALHSPMPRAIPAISTGPVPGLSRSISTPGGSCGLHYAGATRRTASCATAQWED